jgi:hypothetical protein
LQYEQGTIPKWFVDESEAMGLCAEKLIQFCS